MNVVWTKRAVEHLVAIYEYIAQDSPVYAQKTVDALTRRSEQISEFPRMGRTVPEYDVDDIHEVIEGRYRLIYRLKPDQINVLSVIHAARKLTDTPQ